MGAPASNTTPDVPVSPVGVCGLILTSTADAAPTSWPHGLDRVVARTMRCSQNRDFYPVMCVVVAVSIGKHVLGGYRCGVRLFIYYLIITRMRLTLSSGPETSLKELRLLVSQPSSMSQKPRPPQRTSLLRIHSKGHRSRLHHRTNPESRITTTQKPNLQNATHVK
jgi:hypothetical protein